MMPCQLEKDVFEFGGTCEWTYQTLVLARIVIEGLRGCIFLIELVLDILTTF